MSIRFSEVTLSDPTGLTIQVLLDGHPDEDDLRENEYLHDAVYDFEFPIQTSVQRFCYLTDSNEEDADDNHLALISAYDELVDLCNSLNPSHKVDAFTDRDDVEHGEYFTFRVEVPCDE